MPSNARLERNLLELGFRRGSRWIRWKRPGWQTWPKLGNPASIYFSVVPVYPYPESNVSGYALFNSIALSWKWDVLLSNCDCYVFWGNSVLEKGTLLDPLYIMRSREWYLLKYQCNVTSKALANVNICEKKLNSYNIQCFVAQCTVHTAQCTVHTAQCTVHNVWDWISTDSRHYFYDGY